jgi:hypothetical protein
MAVQRSLGVVAAPRNISFSAAATDAAVLAQDAAQDPAPQICTSFQFEL